MRALIVLTLCAGATAGAAPPSDAAPAPPADPAPTSPTDARPDLGQDLRLPPGTRSDAQGQRVSGRGLRETSDFLAAELARRGINAQQLGPYGVRGVELTRFISRTDQTPWLAIHVLRQSGKTLIFFVPRGKSATAP